MNTKLSSVVVACVFVMGAALLGGCDRLRSAETIYERGEKNLATGNPRSALGDFRTVIERQPDHVPARLGMVRAMHFLGDFEGALTTLDLIAQYGGAKEGAPLRYEILLSLGRFEDTLTALEKEADLSDAQKAYFTAYAHAALKHDAEAQTALLRAVELDANNPDVQLLQATIAAERGDVAGAAKILSDALKAHPEDAELWFAQGRQAFASGDLAGAKSALQSAEKFGKRTLNWNQQAQLYALLTETALLEANAEDATRWLAFLNNHAQGSPLSAYLSGRLALLKNDHDAAIVELQRATSAGEFPPAKMLLASLHLSKANFGQAETLLNELFAKQPNNVEVRKLLGQLYLATNRPEEANKVLPQEGAAGDAQLDWLRGQSLIASGASGEGIVLLEKSVASAPGDHAKALQLARAYLMSSQVGKAKTLLESIPPEAGSQRQAMLVLANVANKSRVDAYKEIDALLAKSPNDAMLHAAAGSIVAQSGDLPRARQMLSKAVELDGANLDARLMLANIFFAGKEIDKAEEQLQAVIQQDAKKSTAYVGLAGVALARKDQAKANQLLEQAIGADPTAIEPRLLLAQQALKEKDVRRALGLLDEASTVASGFDQPRLLNVSGLILMQAQQYDDALIRFDRAAALGEAQAPFNAVRVQVATGRREDARRRLNALTNDPKQRLAAVAQLAALDVEDGKVDVALARLDTLRDLKDGQAQVSELEGDIHFVAKNFDKAAASFDRAYKQTPSQRLAIKRYHTLLSINNPAPHDALLAWLKVAPQDFVVRKMLGQYYVHKNDYDKAIAQFESWLRENPARDPEILNDLAWMLWTKGDKRALELAREAHQAVPNRPEVADTYGWLLLDAGKVDEALTILKSALTAAADNPEIQYHYAAAQARAGQKAEAQASLKELLSKHAKFASRGDAEKLLSSL